MAYKRGLPSFNKGIEPEVKRTTVQNPEGTTTYKTSWSSKTPGRSSSFKAPTAKQGTKPVVKRSIPAQTTSGEREITTFPNVKSVGMTSQKITAPLPESVKKPLSRKDISENTEKYREDKWLKDNPGKTTEDRAKERAKNIKEAQNKPREKWQGKGSFKEKKAIKLCNNC